MKKTTLLAVMILLVAALVTSTNRSSADVMPPHRIYSHKECPDGLHVSARRNDGMIDVVVRVDPDKVEQNELYKGRVKATCHFGLFVGKDRVAYGQLQANAENNQTVFRLKISATAASVSHLRLNTHLYEAHEHPTVDGGKKLVPTLGGGRIFQIYPTGFLAPDQQRSASPDGFVTTVTSVDQRSGKVWIEFRDKEPQARAVGHVYDRGVQVTSATVPKAKIVITRFTDGDRAAGRIESYNTSNQIRPGDQVYVREPGKH